MGDYYTSYNYAQPDNYDDMRSDSDSDYDFCNSNDEIRM